MIFLKSHSNTINEDGSTVSMYLICSPSIFNPDSWSCAVDFDRKHFESGGQEVTTFVSVSNLPAFDTEILFIE